MSRKLALPVFLLAAVLCAVRSCIEAKQPTPAIAAEASLSTRWIRPTPFPFNLTALTVITPKALSPTRNMWRRYAPCSRRIEPAEGVEWPAGEEQYLFSKASFVLLSGHGSEELTTADGTAETPRCYILNDRGNDRTLLFVHNGSRSYENK